MPLNIVTNNGEAQIGDANFVNGKYAMALFTDDPVGLDETTALESSLTRPVGGGYADVTMSGWTSGGTSTHPTITFTPSGASWANVRGAFMFEVATGEVFAIVEDANQPLTIADGQPYDVNPSIPVD